jgi:hypothetical protein
LAAVLGLLAAGCSLDAAAVASRADPTVDVTDDRPLSPIAGVAYRSRIEPRLGRAARALTGLDVQVRCWAEADWDQIADEQARYYGDPTFRDSAAYADVDRERVHLSPSACDPLVELVYADQRPRPGQDGAVEAADALETFAHELTHFTTLDEPTAECWAIQRMGGIADELLRDEGYGRELAQLYWTESYPGMPDDYRSQECRDGGRLDLHPSCVGWPIPSP